MTASSLDILLIGFGNMGRALYQGWQAQNHTITIIDPNIDLAVDVGTSRFNAVDDTVRALKPDLVVLAVKPQILSDVLVDYDFLKNSNIPVLSIMAGVSISTLSDFFGADTPIIRTMPNTPSMVGQGMTVCVGNNHTTSAHQTMIDGLLNAVGQVAWVRDENLMHAVTAVSGSGPAYVFYMVEAMALAGIEAGLDKELAVQLARQTIIGSAELLAQSQDAADVLRQRVTSPGGTTQAALNILMQDENGLTALIKRAVSAAAKRSSDLA